METTNIIQALLKVTEADFVSKIFDLINPRTEEWKTGWTACRKGDLVTAEKMVFNFKFVGYMV